MKKTSHIFFVMFFIVVIVNSSVMADQYIIKTGDQLEINIWGHDDFHRLVTVHSNGSIMFPLIGKVELTGKSLNEVKDNITWKISKYIKNPDVMVSIMEPRKLNIGIFGGVNKQGIIQTFVAITLQEAISRAGGLTVDADLSQIIIFTPEGSNILNLNTSPTLINKYMLDDNYSVHIPQEVQRFTVIGEVRNPGSFKYEQGTTFIEAIAMAGYITEKADIEQIFVERFSPQKEQFMIKLDKEHSQLTAGTDVEVHPGDIIYIKEDKNFDLKGLLRMVPFIKDLRDLIYR